jgi:hypothetical protein
LPELSLAPPPPRPELLRQLRARLSDAAPGLRVLAEGVLGEEARIDFVGSLPDGRAALVLVGEAGDDLRLVARGLAQRAWLEPRLRDWLKLAPSLGLRPELGAQVVLLCPAFGAESRAAARALGALAPLLATYRCVRDGHGVDPLVEPLAEPAAACEPPAGRPPASAERRAEAPTLPPFRTGLSDAELELTPEERREFE